jgi:hypothetical protein
MTALLQTLQFGTPLALLGLIALPIIWWLLRFTPPRPKQLRFPAIRILLGLPNQQETPDKTPWWLLLLRLLLAALLIFAVAQPFLQPKGTNLLPVGHRMIVVDNGWAAAKDWTERRNFLLDVLEQARDDGAPVTLVTTADGQALGPQRVAAAQALDQARILKPVALSTDRAALLARLQNADVRDAASILWLADGLDAGSATDFAAQLKALAPSAALRVFTPDTNAAPLALGALDVKGAEIKVPVLRGSGSNTPSATIEARAANGRVLQEAPVEFTTGNAATATITLPLALRNEVLSLSIKEQDHAGAKQLFDDRWRRRSVALETSATSEQSQALLAPLHYLRRGLEPFAELYEPTDDAELQGLMDSGLTMLVQSDVGSLDEVRLEALTAYVERGGILLRFAGPRLAAGGDTLLPVRLREGDRTLGSALSWETPQGLAPFPELSPFAGLTVDPDIRVQRQVLAEPDPEIADRTWASLGDGTPLVTAERRGKGLIVLFHVTSNAAWSNLPLSGLFLEMLQRIAGLDVTAINTSSSSGDGQYVPRAMLTGTGDLVSADGSSRPLAPADFAKAKPTPQTPAGLYVRQGREHALNLAITTDDLAPMPTSLSGAEMAGYQALPRTDMAPWLFALAAALFLLDTLVTLVMGGLNLRKPLATASASLALLLMLPVPAPHAQEAAGAAALQSRLAYVETGDDELDRNSKLGLASLTYFLTERTSAELAEPDPVNIETDELAFYPLIYWPVPDSTQKLSAAASAKLTTYMKNGGMIFFDTRDGGVDLDAQSGNLALQTLLEGLDLPPLEPVPDQHVLTRSFYLLDRFPGRYEGPRPWVESRIGDTDGDPNGNDGVTSVIIGSNDYAAAWATDDAGQPVNAVVPGADRQREFAFRTGVNVVMYALTGNYKADQVHVPAFLERLGQ